MNARCRYVAVLLLMAAGSPSAAASQPSAAGSAASGSRIVRAARFERAPVIDGRVDDEAWVGAVRLETFHQVQPGDNLAPSQTTTVLIGYDRRALYLAFHAADTSGRVRATLARRDAITDDDIVGVYLDTFRDRRRAYYIFFNPYGIQADGIYTEGKPDPDLTVDLVIDSKGTIDTDGNGYTVEAAIPFASLRYERARGGGAAPEWGLHVQRFIRRDRNEQISWMPLSRNRSSLLDQAGALGELVDIGEGRPLEIIPTGVLTDERGSRANPEPGVSVNFGMTPTMNASFTANPDFAQVEADQLVLTANQRFPIFYDEKRPFFLEGIDAFQTPINLIHTRTIVDPDYALKLTGRQGKTTIGVLYADDGADGAKKGAFRVKRDVGRESTVGAMLTTVEDGEAFSRLVSADARVRLSDQTVFTTQIAGSFADVPFPDIELGGTRQRDGRGLGYYAKLERRGRHVLTALTASGSSTDYRADLGFTRRVNTNVLNLQTSYNSEPRPDARLISWTATNVTVATWDWQGRANWVYIYPQLHMNFRRQTSLRMYAYRDYERVFEEEFGVRRGPGRAGAFSGDSERSTNWEGFIVTASTAPNEALAFSTSISKSWDVFDYDFGAGPKFRRVSPAAVNDPDSALDPGAATSTTISGDITWRPLDALRVSLEASRDSLVRNDNGRTAYDSTLLSWRTTYQFTRFTSVRFRTDWDSANATLRGQYLFGWTPTPGTAIYAGYNDVATIDGYDQITGVPVRGFRRNQRTLFVKLSYMLRRVV